jgi:hypothetical protein
MIGIKRLAKRLKAPDQIQHSKALDVAARHAGFSNFIDAKRRLETASAAHGAASSSNKTKEKPVSLSNFHHSCGVQWDRAVASVAGKASASSRVWTSRADIIDVLEPFMGENRNHAHLPTGGGMDFLSVRRASEAGCIEFRVGRRTGYIVKPKRLTMEIIPSLGNSFLRLDLDELEPSGVYHVEADEDEEHEEINRYRRERGSEELLELAPGEYEDRSLWVRGFLGYDRHGEEIPMPDSARIVVRFFRGSILFVAKGSHWNGNSRTYDGEHDKLSIKQIRQIVEHWVAEDA